MSNNRKGVATSAGAINAPLKWHEHGGKHYLAPKIRALFPPHVHYVEPFFGGGAVLLAGTGEGVSEVVNDLHCGLTNFWQVLGDSDAFAEFQRHIAATPFSESEWEEQSGPWRQFGDIRVSPRDRREAVVYAVSFFIACRQSRQGLMRDFATLSRNRTRRGMNEQVSSWLTAVEGLPEVHARLRRVVILNRDAIEVIRQQDGPQTLYYCDPPYVHQTRNTTGEYEHEMTAGQHEALLKCLGSIEGKFILSGYPSEMYAEAERLYGWRHVDFDLPNNASSRSTKERKTERVWMNFVPAQEAA